MHDIDSTLGKRVRALYPTVQRVTITALAGGRNNRAFRIDTDQGQFFAKSYYVVPGGRPRCRSEVEFSKHALAMGASAPRLIDYDYDQQYAMFEFLDGRKITEAELSGEHIDAAVQFVKMVQCAEGQSVDLLEGSEACFSDAQHTEVIDRRVCTARALGANLPPEVQAILENHVAPGWQRLKQEALRHSVQYNDPISRSQRVISPSDFGFHNAFIVPARGVVFFDFEHAGWDDPAKLLCDFFSQPEVPVADSFVPSMVQALSNRARPREWLEERFQRLLPCYRIKWFCIMLNEFDPQSKGRRAFAGRCSAGDLEAQRDRIIEYYHSRVRLYVR